MQCCRFHIFFLFTSSRRLQPIPPCTRPHTHTRTHTHSHTHTHTLTSTHTHSRAHTRTHEHTPTRGGRPDDELSTAGREVCVNPNEFDRATERASERESTNTHMPINQSTNKSSTYQPLTHTIELKVHTAARHSLTRPPIHRLTQSHGQARKQAHAHTYTHTHLPVANARVGAYVCLCHDIT
eukprot:GHVU01064744.1.p1 GENE.GHVU01064744.1~~GHVU01064744.1.p1  ORF type:complete len:182 (-),score=5.99 GHVU01064744.1:30-575(-)